MLSNLSLVQAPYCLFNRWARVTPGDTRFLEWGHMCERTLVLKFKQMRNIPFDRARVKSIE
jgi:hypothetical protein